MAAHEVPMQILDADHVHRAWKQALDAVASRGERIVVEEQGVPVAAIVSVHDLARLAHFDAQRAERFAVLDRIGAAFADEDPDESDALAALAVAKAREQVRRERADQHQA
jgi:antitoxin (DNA-binding transcriptional repressor) of toxin-antitoxin stability system